MIVKVLGPGCANCHRLEDLVVKAVAELGIDVEVVKVTDYAEIMAFGIMSTPGLVVDEEVRIAGRVPAYDDVKRILQTASAR